MERRKISELKYLTIGIFREAEYLGSLACILCAIQIALLVHGVIRTYGGVLARRAHSANYYVVCPENTPENHPPTDACMINSKQHGVQKSGPWDLWQALDLKKKGRPLGEYPPRAHPALYFYGGADVQCARQDLWPEKTLCHAALDLDGVGM